MVRSAFFLGCCLLCCWTVTAVEPVAVGSSAPEITMTGVDGREFKLSEIIGTGKNVALIFSRAHW